METVTIVIDAANAIMKYNVLIVVPIGCCFDLFVWKQLLYSNRCGECHHEV